MAMVMFILLFMGCGWAFKLDDLYKHGDYVEFYITLGIGIVIIAGAIWCGFLLENSLECHEGAHH